MSLKTKSIGNKIFLLLVWEQYNCILWLQQMLGPAARRVLASPPPYPQLWSLADKTLVQKSHKTQTLKITPWLKIHFSGMRNI